MDHLKALREQFKTVLTEAESIRLKFAGTPETMSAEDESRWSQLMDEADSVKARIETGERHQKIENWANESAGMLPLLAAATPADAREVKAANTDDVAGRAFKSFIRGGLKSVSQDGLKALQADNPAGGGYLVAPQQFVQELLSNVRDMVFIRQMARMFTMTSSESMGVPTLETFVSDADWTQELATGTEDTSLAFGKRELKPVPLAKRVKLSNKLLRQASIDPEAVVREQLAYKFGVTEEKAFLTGTGSNQPLGVFTASAQGIDTSRDVTAASSTAVAADDLINTKYALKPQYLKTARWLIHRDVLKAIRKLKDSNNNYVWATGLGPGQGFQGTAPTLLDLPYEVSEYAPNTFTTGLYMAILGDFRFYWIADALDMQIQVLDQLYAETNQTGYIGRKETDGMPVLAEAFTRLRLA